MLNHHSHSRPDSRSPPFLLHGLPPAPHAAAAETAPERRDHRMDPPSSSGRGPATPRRQLQGPRPPRLNVRMESHAIKKHQPSGSSGPAAAGAPAAQPAQGGGPARRDRDQLLQTQQQHQRAPVIIYDASPKVIHAKPSEFMALVQRLTGPGSGAPQQQDHHHQTAGDDGDDVMLLGQTQTTTTTTFLPPELLLSPSAAMSPAARLATIERSVRPTAAPAPDYDDALAACCGAGPPGGGGGDDGTLSAMLGPARHHPSILSPLPSSLPPAAASGLFSPLPFDAANISWLNELSPILRAASTGPGGASASSSAFAAAAAAAASGGSRPPPPAYYSDPFVPSPRNLLSTPTVPSPTTVAEFFGSLPDF